MPHIYFEDLLKVIGLYLCNLSFKFAEDEASFERKFILNCMCPLLEMCESVPLDVFMPILVVSHSFKELHEVHVLSDLLRLILVRRSLNIYLPVELLHALADLFLADLDHWLVVLQPGQVICDGLIVVYFCLVEDHLVLGEERILESEKICSA